MKRTNSSSSDPNTLQKRKYAPEDESQSATQSAKRPSPTPRYHHHHQKCPPLPAEIWLMVFEYLDLIDMLQVSQVNRFFHRLAHVKSIWRRIPFQLDSIVRMRLPTVRGDDDGDERGGLGHIPYQKSVLKRQYPPNTSIWHLNTTTHPTPNNNNKNNNSSSQFLISLCPPSPHFLRCASTRHRFSNIQVLKLTHSTHPITDSFLLSLLPLLPHLIGVDLSSCSMLTDASIHELVRDSRRRKELRWVRLKRCFGLTWRSLEYIGRWCWRVEEVDLEMCGGVMDQGLMMLVYKRADTSRDGSDIDESSDDEVNGRRRLNRIVYTLRKLNLSGADFLSETVLSHFLSVLTSVAPRESQLSEVELSNTFCVTANVLNHIYADHHHHQSNNKKSGGGGGMKRELVVGVRNCDLLMRSDVDRFRMRMEKLMNMHDGFGDALSGIHVYENCKMLDDSLTSVRHYLDSILG